MSCVRAIAALVMGFAGLAPCAFAQEQPAIAATNKGGLASLFPGAYAVMELRHSTQRVVDSENRQVSDKPSLQLRPTLGSTFFNSRMDSSFTWVFRKRPDTTVVERVYLMNLTQIKALEGRYGNFGPYFETYQANGGSFNESYVGFYGELNKDLESSAAKLSFNAYSQPVGLFRDQHSASSQINQVAPKNDTEQSDLTLQGEDAEGNATLEQRDPDLFHFYGLNMRVVPSFAPSFSIKGAVDLLHRYRPKYVATQDQSGDVRTELAGYEVTSLTLNRILLSYRVNEKVTLTNQFRQYIGGIYESAIDNEHADRTGMIGNFRYENRLQLTAVLM